jgi:aspartyl-tRNA(Asn)/glutamyl-tRNA(Gln) amidotransferase subunit C
MKNALAARGFICHNMFMDIDELRVTAQLAHIEMDEAALREAFPAFEQMLDFFQAMQAADGDAAITDLLAAGGDSRPLAVSGDFRPDLSTDAGTVAVASEVIIAKAGESDGRFMVIPNVL